MSGKTTPAPLVLQPVETVFTVASIPVVLGNGQQFIVERGDQDLVLVLLYSVLHLDEGQLELLADDAVF
jgi:hypothetical protein